MLFRSVAQNGLSDRPAASYRTAVPVIGPSGFLGYRTFELWDVIVDVLSDCTGRGGLSDVAPGGFIGRGA